MKKDWTEAKLENVSAILDNLRKPINNTERQKRIAGKPNDELYPYFGATGQVGYIDDYLTDGEFILIGEDAAPFYDIGRDVAYKISGKTWVNNHAHILKSHFNDKFLLHYLNAFDYHGYVSGTTRLKLTQASLKTIPISVPPLPIQRAIVARIEELFSELDQGIADLKRAQAQLKIYRQAVLKKAFDGDWEKSTIQDLFTFTGGGTPSKKENDYWGGDIPWASVKDMKGEYLNSTIDSITPEGLKNSASNLALENEVILVTRIAPGKAVISKIQTAINQDLKVIRPRRAMNSKYTFYLIKSVEREVVQRSSGTTVMGINLNNLNSIIVPDLGRNQQEAVVKKIEANLSVCDTIEQTIKESLSKAEALRQSILKKAFEGKLLTQEEITRCEQEPDYEPAAVLLERIKQEKRK